VTIVLGGNVPFRRMLVYLQLMTEKPTKIRFLDRVADENGVAVVVLDQNGVEVSASNNNSICRTLWDSVEFRPECNKFCGKAFENVHASTEPVSFVCHAGLTCKAVPVTDRGKEFVAITGRTFLHGENYRQATEKAITGEWSKFKPTEFFENILMSGSAVGLEKAIGELGRFVVHHRNDILEIEKEETPRHKAEIDKKIAEFNEQAATETPTLSVARQTPAFVQDPAAGWRSLFGSLMKLDYGEACREILKFLDRLYVFDSLVWLDRRGDLLVPVCTEGDLAGKKVRFTIPVNNDRLIEAVRTETPLVLRERNVAKDANRRGLALFPVTIGNEIRSAFAVEGLGVVEETTRSLSRFAKIVGPQIEILRLRDEVSHRDWVSQGVRRFSDSLKKIDTDDFWLHVTQVSAELLQAERASLLVRGEKSNSLYAKASIGSATDLKNTAGIGARIARGALDHGDPIVVSDIARSGISVAPNDWHYKTSSFISFPILIGDRRIAVMNFTDRAGGDAFGDRDLELLQTIAPQIAVAIDRTALKDRAGEFEQLSVTDSLTGLLNRRYLDERLEEEMTRARRHSSAITLMMIDVDNFKSYNDSFGHPAGDLALKMVSVALKDTLRADDVAARFGGEEFAILLPRTNAEEAAAIAERIRMRVEHTAFPNRRITISIGIASQSNDFDTPKDWVTAADMALYEAKHLGRNNVQVYDNMGRSFKERIN
jgi:diguanylate cyclase (GGDEF)-like protein